MSFIIDEQTLEDLNLLGKYRRDSIFSLFNATKTRGGERLLDQMFRNPLMNPEAIDQRSSVIRYFRNQKFDFFFDPRGVEMVRRYLGDPPAHLPAAVVEVVRKKSSGTLFRTEDYDELLISLKATIQFLCDFIEFMEQADSVDEGAFAKQLREIQNILQDPNISRVFRKADQLVSGDRVGERRRASTWRMIRCHHLLNCTLNKKIEQLLEYLYELDIYIAVAEVAEQKQMAQAKVLPKEEHCLRATELRHPSLENATTNSITMDAECNVFFLTGANMAGKSTLMKTIGVNAYLAHLGMPVAADKFEFSVRGGIHSNINVPDDLSKGYSHFYAEVLRIKEVARKISEGHDLLVLFDELFKGTNVKDAYDATLAVISRFADYRNCLFVISTHIVEVGDALKEARANIQYWQLPTHLDGNIPQYTYRLEDGISSDRHGMIIIENEKILEMLKS